MSRIPLLKVRGLVESFIWSSQRRKRHWQRGKCGLCRVTSAAQGPGTCQPPIFHTSRRLLLIFRLSRERKRVDGKKGFSFSFSFFPTFQIILWFFFFYLFIYSYVYFWDGGKIFWSDPLIRIESQMLNEFHIVVVFQLLPEWLVWAVLEYWNSPIRFDGNLHVQI